MILGLHRRVAEPQQFGILGSSFFFLFSISAIVVGFIVNRVPTRWVLLALGLIWALAQFPMVGTVGFATLILMLMWRPYGLFSTQARF